MNDTVNRANFAPKGWHTVTPRIVVDNASQLVEFLRQVFGATGEYRQDRPSEIRIGDSIVMIGNARIRNATTGFLYSMSTMQMRRIDVPSTRVRVLSKSHSIRPMEIVAVWSKTNGGTRGKSPCNGKSDDAILNA
jgi:uncharacterized glyoxalase superfamily protein PhnB